MKIISLLKSLPSDSLNVIRRTPPIVFAMANPDPEISPDELRKIRPDAIIATGRSDYPNQVNNVLGFPYIFRGALDVRASAINIDMKIAATKALADLAKQDVPDEVSNAYSGKHLQFGPEYIIPKPFDARLLTTIPPAVAKAAADSGVARKPIKDELGYRSSFFEIRDFLRKELPKELKLRGLARPSFLPYSTWIAPIRTKPKRIYEF